DVIEHAAVAQTRVHYAVERNAAGHAESRRSRALAQPRGETDDRLFEHDLQRTRDVVMALFDLRTAQTPRAEAPLQLQVVDGIAAVVADRDHAPKFVDELGAAERRERHHLVLVG